MVMTLFVPTVMNEVWKAKPERPGMFGIATFPVAFPLPSRTPEKFWKTAGAEMEKKNSASGVSGTTPAPGSGMPGLRKPEHDRPTRPRRFVRGGSPGPASG